MNPSPQSTDQAGAGLPAIADQPGATEAEFAREPCALFTREMLLTADADIAIVRIFGSDKGDNAVRIGLSPERAMRLGAAMIRAALRIKPALRLQVEEIADRPDAGGAS